VARLVQQFRQHGVAFVGIFVQDTEADVRKFAQQFGFTFPSGLDEDMEVARLYRVTGTPATVFVGPRQEILERVAGPMTERAFGEKLQRHLCAGWAREADEAFETVKSRQRKEADHWRKELTLADRRCREGKSKQARGMYDHVMEEMRREGTKK